MSNLQMEIYTAFDGRHMTVVWKNETEYQAVKKFFLDHGADVCGIHDNLPGGRELIFIESEAQMDGLKEFVHSLRESTVIGH